MGNDDARSLDSQDTGGFAHPRGGQRAGGRKPLGCRAHFGCYRTDNVWLAGALPARRLGRFEGQTVIRPSAEVERARDAMDLRHGDAEEPVAAAIFVRIVDARDGGDAGSKENSTSCWPPIPLAGCWRRSASLVRSHCIARSNATSLWFGNGSRKNTRRSRRWPKKQGVDIYFGDAAHIRSDHHAGRTWGTKGDTPIVQATGARHGMSVQGLSHAGVARSRRRRMISAVKPDEPASNFQQRDTARVFEFFALLGNDPG